MQHLEDYRLRGLISPISPAVRRRTRPMSVAEAQRIAGVTPTPTPAARPVVARRKPARLPVPLPSAMAFSGSLNPAPSQTICPTATTSGKTSAAASTAATSARWPAGNPCAIAVFTGVTSPGGCPTARSATAGQSAPPDGFRWW